MKLYVTLLAALCLLATTAGCRALARYQAGGPDGALPPDGLLPPPPPDDAQSLVPDGSVTACSFESPGGVGDDVVGVWGSAQYGPFAATATALYIYQDNHWQPYTSATGPWPLTKARKMHGLDHWLAVAGDDGPTALLAVVDLEKGTFQTTTSPNPGSVTDVLVRASAIPQDSKDPTKDAVLLLQENGLSGSAITNLKLVLDPLASVPASASLTAMMVADATVVVLGHDGPATQLKGFRAHRPPLSTTWSLTYLTGMAPLAGWSDATAGVIVGSGGLTRHGLPLFGEQYPLIGTAQAVWGRSADDIYAVGQAGLLTHFDSTAWRSLDQVASPPQNLVDVWGAPGRALWIAVSGNGAQGQGGVLSCALP